MEEEKKRLLKEMEKVKESDLPKREKEKRINELAKQLGKLFLGENSQKRR